jgi:hypothetical protein
LSVLIRGKVLAGVNVLRRAEGLPPVSMGQLKFCMSKYGVDPVGRVGTLGVWTPDTVERVHDLLKLITGRRRRTASTLN